MLRIKRFYPAVALTLATATLVAPAAQARPASGHLGASAVGSSPLSNKFVRDFPVAGPGVGRVHRDTGSAVRDFPTANPVQTVDTRGLGLIHSSSVTPSTNVGGSKVGSPSSSGFDWTAAAIGAGTTGVIMLMLAGGVSIRRRGQLAT
ncbi:MAG TPA: hypothetical protein VE777_16300 [Gaiellales bacterium]|jgi:hypothetical protein|nr:hypothetical protein [Gaiellales bacterium]